MNQKSLILLAALTLTACEPPEPYVQPEYERAPMEYTCSVEQAARVQKESTYCDENTSFFSSYCYGSAIMRICEKKNGS